MFKALAGFIDHQGEVFLNGVCCHQRQRTTVAFIPQRSDVDWEFPITVDELVVSGRRRFHRWWQRPTADDHEHAAHALRDVGLDGFGSRTVGALSGGQMQRAFLARALAQDAEVLLLDEALSGVDAPSTAEMFDLFDALAERGVTMMISTHDLALARRRFKRVLALHGTVRGDGSPDDVLEGAMLESVFGSRR
jgi:manganese/iron transport system ATP-binding protein